MEALGLILKETFDAVLLDLTMPEFSGLDVIQNLKDSGDLEKNKIILLTAVSVSAQEIQKWIDMGVKNFLRKPFDPIMLFDSISNVTTQP
jgi:DNA-binding response OmpR family regulator